MAKPTVFTDSVCIQGQRHARLLEPGQDYACHGEAFAVISDGCSQIPKSEIAAMMWSNTAASLGDLLGLGVEDVVRHVGDKIEQAHAQGMIGPMHEQAATLGWARLHDHRFEARLIGDGAILVWHADDRFEVIQLHALNSAPFYPCAMYDRLHDLWTTNGGYLQVNHWFFQDGQWVLEKSSAAPQGYAEFTWDKDDVLSVAVASDGVFDWCNTDWKDALAKVAHTPQGTGQVGRRMMLGLLRKLKDQPNDDLSIGIVGLNYAVLE